MSTAAIVTLEPLPGGQTRYTTRALHWTEEARAQHEAMVAGSGGNQCLDQVAALVEKA